MRADEAFGPPLPNSQGCKGRARRNCSYDIKSVTVMSASCWRCQLPTRAAITRLRWALLPQRFGRATEQTADVTTAACRSLQRAQRSVCSTVPLQDSRGGNVRATAGGVRALSRRHSMLQNTVRAASTTQSDSTPSTGRPHAGLRLFVYSKDGCHLCDTLKVRFRSTDALLTGLIAA